MASFCKLSIILDKQDNVYEPGDSLSGSVSLLTERKVSISGVELLLRGAADVRWAEVKHEPQGKTDVEHCAQEVYFNEKYVLWGSGQDEKCQDLEEFSQGRHLFPFQLDLPEQLPCSFEGSNGWIRYSACASVSCYNDKDLKETLFFTILGELDLNTISDKEEEREGDEDSILRSSCCTAGRINCSLNVPQRLVVPGQQLIAYADVKNLASKKIKSCSVLLIQTETYSTSAGVSHKVRKELGQALAKAIKPGKCQSWTCDSLYIPPVPPSNLQPYRFISVVYHLVLRLALYPHPAEISVPLMVGTVPQSRFLYSYWFYATQRQPSKSKRHVSCDPANESLHLQGNWLPLYKVYRPLTPIHSLISLEESPGMRRKPYNLDLEYDLRNNESVV